MIAILCTDLFSRVKIEEILDKRGITHVSVSGKEDPGVANAQTILVDLSHPRGFEVIAAAPQKCVGFGPHAMTSLFARAKKEGCARLYPRSIFFNALPELVST